MKYLWLFWILVLIPFVSAIPDYPHIFYGSVSDNDGLLGFGTVSAKLCDEEFSISIVDGHYGLSDAFLVWREDCSDTNIEFFVDSTKVDDFTYEPYGKTELDLIVPVFDVQDDPPVDDNPPIDNTPTNDDVDTGKERDTSHIQPPPGDIVFDSRDTSDEQSSVQDVQSSKSTGKVVYEFFTKTKPGVVTLSVAGGAGILGLLYLLKLLLLR